MSELELLQEINDNIKRLSAVITVQSFDDTKKILTLQKLGYNSTQISDITGIPVATVKAKWKKGGKQ